MQKNQSFLKSYGWILAAIFCTMLWGSASPAIKIGYELFQMDTSNVFNVFIFAGLRFFGGGFMTLLLSRILMKEKTKFTLSMLGPSAALALAQTAAQYIFFYLGLAVVSGSVGSILSSTNVFITVLLVTLVFPSEKLTFRKLLACILGFLGIIILNIGSDFQLAFRINGEGFILFSALANAIANLLIRHFGQKHNPVALTGYQFILGGGVLTIIGLIGGGRLQYPGIKGILLMAYLMLVSALAYGIWSLLLKNQPASHVVIFHSIVPIFGAIFSWLALGDHIWNWQTLLALFTITLGIAIINIQFPKKTPTK